MKLFLSSAEQVLAIEKNRYALWLTTILNLMSEDALA